MGVFPMAPFEDADHSLPPSTEADAHYVHYGSLFAAVRGKTWVLTPHAVNVTGGSGAVANAFDVGSRKDVSTTTTTTERASAGERYRVWPIVMGVANSTAVLSVTAPAEGCAELDVLLPGPAQQWTALPSWRTTMTGVAASSVVVEANVTLGVEGCAVLRCKPPDHRSTQAAAAAA